MSKEKEKKTARILFVEQGKTRKEIAQLLGVTEKSVGAWVDKFSWDKERTARTASPEKRSDNIKEIITTLSEERIELAQQVKEAELKADLDTIADLRTQISKIDDAVAKWNKTLMTISSDTKITLGVYIRVMEQLFSAMRAYDAKLYMQTIEFQERHLNKITIDLG